MPAAWAGRAHVCAVRVAAFAAAWRDRVAVGEAVEADEERAGPLEDQHGRVVEDAVGRGGAGGQQRGQRRGDLLVGDVERDEARAWPPAAAAAPLRATSASTEASGA